MTQTNRNCFTVSQAYLGSPLAFEPALGSKELDRLVNDFVSGNGTLQQKRAQVSLEFFNAIELENLSHPVSRRYHVQRVTFTPSPSTASMDYSSPEGSASPAASKSLKRSMTGSSMEPSAKRLPGFSIMTRDGVDITEYASRGPKTKEQRDHAALMRKLKACGPCKRSKQRCDPSHHRVGAAASPAGTPSSATPSLTSRSSWSQASISPQSAIEDSFNSSPNQKASTIAHAGDEFFSSLFESSQNTFSPVDMSLSDALDISFDTLPLQDFDPQFFDLADVDLNFPTAAQPQSFNPADWAMWDVHTANTRTTSQSPTQSSSTGSLDQSSASLLESWDGQQESHPQFSPMEHPEESSQFYLESWDIQRESRSQSSVEVPRLSTLGHGALDMITNVNIDGDQSLQTTAQAMSRQSSETTSLVFQSNGPLVRPTSGSRLATNETRSSCQVIETSSVELDQRSEQLQVLPGNLRPYVTALRASVDEPILSLWENIAPRPGGSDFILSASEDLIASSSTGCAPESHVRLLHLPEGTGPIVRLSRHSNARHYQTLHSTTSSEEQLPVSGDILESSTAGHAQILTTLSRGDSGRLQLSSGETPEVSSGTHETLLQSSEHFEFELQTVQQSRFIKAREYVRTECAIYAAMAILSFSTMVFFPQWTMAMIFVLAKVLHSWPDVMALVSSSPRDCPEVTSQGTPEENETCSVLSISSSRQNQPQSATSSVMTMRQELTSSPNKTSPIDSLYSFASTLSHNFKPGNFSRDLPVLKR